MVHYSIACKSSSVDNNTKCYAGYMPRYWIKQTALLCFLRVPSYLICLCQYGSKASGAWVDTAQYSTEWFLLNLLSSTLECCVATESGDILALFYRNPLGSAISSGYPSLNCKKTRGFTQPAIIDSSQLITTEQLKNNDVRFIYRKCFAV